MDKFLNLEPLSKTYDIKPKWITIIGPKHRFNCIRIVDRPLLLCKIYLNLSYLCIFKGNMISVN